MKRALLSLTLLLAACARADDPAQTVELRGYAPADAARLRAAGWSTDVARAVVPLDSIRVGPIDADAFVPIDSPAYTPAAELELDPREPVLVLRDGERAHAWPLAHLVRRELVLDELDGAPIVVTYCSLCATARAYDRRVDGEVLELAVSGLVLEGNGLLYDRATMSLWRQRDGRAVVGARAGEQLAPLPAFTVSFGALREAHPDARVMRAPAPGGAPPLARVSADDVLRGRPPAWLRVPGEAPLELMLRFEGGTCEVRGASAELASALVLRDPATGWPGDPGAGPRGSAAAFSRELDGRALDFERCEGGARDAQTGSRWNLLGEAVEGPLAGRALEPLPQVLGFRFALSSSD